MEIPPSQALLEEPALSHPVRDPLDWELVFGNSHPVEVEVGSGKGVFLARIAALEPGVNFLGVEIRRKRVEKIVRRVTAAGLPNVRVLAGDARRIFENAIPAGSVRRVHLNFPDPWPKRRHAKRRIFKGGFPALVHRALEDGGVWLTSTDVESYALEMAAAVEGTGLFRNAAGGGRFSGRPENYPASIHEEKFRAWGRSIYRLQWIKK